MVRLDKLSLGLGDVLAVALPTASVLWTYGAPTGESLADIVVALQLASGPSVGSQNKVRGQIYAPPQSITLAIPAVVVGALYRVWANGFPLSHQAAALDTVDTIRDSLVSQLNASAYDSFLATATLNLGEFLLTPDSFGSIWELQITSNITVVDLTLEAGSAELTQGQQDLGVAIQVFAKKANIRDGAMQAMSRIMDCLQRRTSVQALFAQGIAITDRGTVSDISALSGPRWESRAAATIGLTMISTDWEQVSTIGSVGFGVAILGQNGSTIETIQFVTVEQ